MGVLDKIFRKKRNNAFYTEKHYSHEKMLIEDKKNKEIQQLDIKEKNEVQGSIDENSSLDTPKYQGDYAKTIFLWKFSKLFELEKIDYPAYLTYECGIRNLTQYLHNLINEGYFIGASYIDVIKYSKVNELKTILRENELKVSGKKEDLIKRIINNISQEKLETYINSTFYKLSEKGIDFLNEHDDYVRLHKNKVWGIDIEKYNILKVRGYSFYDTIMDMFKQRLSEEPSNLRRNTYLFMYQLSKEEGKDKEALKNILKVFYYDISGICGEEWIASYKEGIFTKKELKKDYELAVMIVPNIITTIHEYKGIYVKSDLDEVFNEDYSVQLCDRTEFEKIIDAIMHDTLEIEKLDAMLKKNYIKLVNNL